MKLPENRNDRIKLAVVIVLGSVCVLYVLAAFVLGPIARNKAGLHTTAADLTEKIRLAKMAVQQGERHEAENHKVLASLISLAGQSNHVLRATLGNYLLGATKIIDDISLQCGVSVGAVREIGIAALPAGTAGADGPVFSTYTVQITWQAGLHALVAWLDGLETANPYVCVSSLSIEAVADSPEAHSLKMDVQWPIWKEERTFDEIHRRAAGIEDSPHE